MRCGSSRPICMKIKFPIIYTAGGVPKQKNAKKNQLPKPSSKTDDRYRGQGQPLANNEDGDGDNDSDGEGCGDRDGDGQGRCWPQGVWAQGRARRGPRLRGRAVNATQWRNETFSFW